ncbi:L,D-transpeptidase family protein [Candidatus Peregrinibacteria bacterium]|nr:L,D-transpeptidase family protein [Candidatus Peregrinibacteria bacterium]
MNQIVTTFLSILSTFSMITIANAQVVDAASQATENLIVSCHVDRQTEAVYDGVHINNEFPGQVEPEELFNIKIRVKNTGNMPWFSERSGCDQSVVNLGTTRAQDRASIFHAPTVFGDTRWKDSNRIKMKSLRVDPGEIAEFDFLAKAPSDAGLYREYFAPVAENITWIKEDAETTFDIIVGNPEMDESILQYSRHLQKTTNLLAPEFEGEKLILVDISDQKMFLKIGEHTVKEFPVSTGTYRTPTPFGTTRISLKQDVRVAYAWPHYIMPKFMMFRAGGYGIHALPSLANDGGVFWSEALNHIGTRRSHGCIRLLPKDADFAYKFTDIGTTVTVIP